MGWFAVRKRKNKSMGLDIHFATTKKDFYSEAENAGKEFYDIGLSREFCNLFFRDDVVEHENELSQIGKITNIDINPIEQMTWYCDEISLKEQLGIYLEYEEKEKQEFIKEKQDTNKLVIGNIEEVMETIDLLIKELSKIEDLPSLLLKTNFDTLSNKRYFSNFNKNLGEGYIDNNFGQDLRNLREFVVFAKSIGEETVYFRFA